MDLRDFLYLQSMLLTLEIPDAMAHSLALDGPSQERQALELLALEGYRTGKLSRGQVGTALGMGFDETEEFLYRNNAMLDYSFEELERGSEILRRLHDRQ